jgi:ferric-dicitrate binding protein FerR (iron transport regulator)
MLTEGGHAVRAQQRRADETTYPVTPEQRAARSQRRRAVKCLCLADARLCATAAWLIRRASPGVGSQSEVHT